MMSREKGGGGSGRGKRGVISADVTCSYWLDWRRYCLMRAM